MGVAVLHPRDILKGPFSRNTFDPHMKCPRYPNAFPNKRKKPQPNDRRRRSPPRPQDGGPPLAPPPLPPVPTTVASKGLKKKIHNKNNGNNINNHLVVGHVRILKRGEKIAKTVTDLVVEDPDLVVEDPDLGSTRRIGPDPELVPTQIRLSDGIVTPSFYAGPVTLTSPPPSDVPLPAFCSKKRFSMFKADDATNNLIRILRLEI